MARTLNEELKRRGYSSKKSRHMGRKDVFDPTGVVVLTSVTAQDVWNWLHDRRDRSIMHATKRNVLQRRASKLGWKKIHRNWYEKLGDFAHVYVDKGRFVLAHTRFDPKGRRWTTHSTARRGKKNGGT